MPEHRIDVDGRTLCVEESGVPDGRAVFVLHGTPGARIQWRGLVEDAESRGIRLVSYDRPGYGGSDSAPGRTVVDAAHDVAAIADALGLERFAVEGGSGGGPHALACTQLPDRVVAVASLAGVAPWGAEGLDWLDGMGQDNLDEFGATLEGEDVLRRYLLGQRDDMLASNPQTIAETMESLLCPPDRACLTGELADFLYDQVHTGIRPVWKVGSRTTSPSSSHGDSSSRTSRSPCRSGTALRISSSRSRTDTGLPSGSRARRCTSTTRTVT